MNFEKERPDYYAILGVKKDATATEIKKKFRKLAAKHHPDKGGDSEIFKEIGEAYDVLGNEQKRKEYDEGPTAGFTLDDLINPRRRGEIRVRPVKVHVEMSLEDIFKGKTVKEKYPRVTLKKTDLGSPMSCSDCSGRGVKIHVFRQGPIVQQVQQGCDTCMGSGHLLIREEKELEVAIPPGSSGYEPMVIEGEGNEYVSNDEVKRGDVVVIVHDQPHATFERGDFRKSKALKDPSNLWMSHKIDFVSSLCGISETIKGVDGKDVWIQYDRPTSSGDTVVVRGQGMPNKYGGRGDLIIQLGIESAHLSYDQRKALYKSFTGKDFDKRDNDKDGLTPALTLKGEEYAQENYSGHAYDEDDDHDHDQPSGCAQQ